MAQMAIRSASGPRPGFGYLLRFFFQENGTAEELAIDTRGFGKIRAPIDQIELQTWFLTEM